jgi:hypothetical protein
MHQMRDHLQLVRPVSGESPVVVDGWILADEQSSTSKSTGLVEL